VAEHLKALDAKRQAAASRRAAANKSKAKSAVPGAVATSGTGGEANPLQAALVAMEAQTGHVRAMVGGRDFLSSNFNRATQAKRQAGSAFKPFIYAAALEAGFTPASVIDHLNDPIGTGRDAWTPEDEHSTASSMTMRTALRTSSNRAAVRMLQEVGIARAVQEAKELGVGDVPSVPSLALGSGEVTVASMTAAYAAFANHGIVPKPVFIRRVEDRDGVLLYQSHEAGTRAISDVTAFLMSNMLADVINAGTGARARSIGFKLPAAGKTGTTNEYRDAWFVGFTPTLVTGVWVGFDQPRHDSGARIRVGRGGAAVGVVHEGRDDE
jgi:penicillin-binding protein 1A